MSVDLDHLCRWIGRTEEAADRVTAAPLACLSATLDRAGAVAMAAEAGFDGR